MQGITHTIMVACLSVDVVRFDLETIGIRKVISIITENHDTNYASIQGSFYQKDFNELHPGDLVKHNSEKIKGETIIGNDVWIGDSAIILSGKIGDGACIAAGVSDKECRAFCYSWRRSCQSD